MDSHLGDDGDLWIYQIAGTFIWKIIRKVTEVFCLMLLIQMCFVQLEENL